MGPDSLAGRHLCAQPHWPTISIHVYGADIERLGSSIYRRFDDWPVLSGPRAARTSAVSVAMS